MTPPVARGQTHPVLMVGSGVVDAGLGDVVVALAERTHTGVLNTYCAKGLFAFDHPAHLGTVGLQANDLVLAGVLGADPAFPLVVAVGIGPDELPGGLPPSVVVVAPAELTSLTLPTADRYPDRPPLYDALAEVCGPLYTDGTLPLSPVRAAGDLSAWLPGHAVVVAAGGVAGFWIGRTFPTRRPATVWLPPGRDAGFVDRTVAARVEAGDTVVVVAGPGDAGVSPGVVAVGAPVVVERWLPTGPPLSPSIRIARLEVALHGTHEMPTLRQVAPDGPHEVPEVEVGVRIDDLAAIEAVAGPVAAWHGAAGA